MSVSQAELLTEIILENKYTSLLELGFKHGVSTCYLAAALDEQGSGQITTIDLDCAKDETPNIDSLLAATGLGSYVKPYYENTSYNWRLMRLLEENPAPQFDFCYIDGAHDWYVDGFAFMLVDLLLKPGGMVVFDDLDWTYRSSPSLSSTARVKAMADDEVDTPHVRQVYELLVKSNPSYSNFVEKDNWAYAQKLMTSGDAAASQEIRREVVYKEVEVGLGAAIGKVFSGVKRRLP